VSLIVVRPVLIAPCPAKAVSKRPFSQSNKFEPAY
jgi:hypothetical protein